MELLTLHEHRGNCACGLTGMHASALEGVESRVICPYMVIRSRIDRHPCRMQVIVKEGDVGTEYFLILGGRVAVAHGVTLDKRKKSRTKIDYTQALHSTHSTPPTPLQQHTKLLLPLPPPPTLSNSL
jgi:hypothetical protein